jgi:hypothetical protein
MTDKEPGNLVPTTMTADDLLEILREAVAGRALDRADVQRQVSEVVNRAGAADLLLEVLKTGDAFQTQQAAYGLGFARSELIRRRLRMLALASSGDRRLACLAALTPEELETFIARQGNVARRSLLESSSLIALNRPQEFVDLVCDGSAVVKLATVDEIEAMRRRYGIGSVSLYAPLLQRPLTSDAIARVAAILGAESDPEARDLLRGALSRAKDDDTRKTLRREQLRHASRAIVPPQADARAGFAVIRPVLAENTAWLDIYEELPGGQAVQSSLCWPIRRRLDFMSTPLDVPLAQYQDVTVDPGRDAKISLGQARAFLEGVPESLRKAIGPILDRLQGIQSEELAPPTPEGSLSSDEARAVLRRPVWSEWQPFAGLVTDATPTEAELAQTQLSRRGGATWLAEGLRHMALVMHLRGESEAPAVAAEAVWTARKRASPLVLALAEAELKRSSLR